MKADPRYSRRMVHYDSPTPAITLSTPDTQAEHWSLHASSIWVSALYIVDHISELGLPTNTPLRLIELGAGAGLPSILIARSYPNVHVLASDFPYPLLIHTLCENVARNDASVDCSVVLHAWDTDPSSLLPAGRHCPRGGHAVELRAARRSASHGMRGLRRLRARALRCGNAHGMVHTRIVLSGSERGRLRAGRSD